MQRNKEESITSLLGGLELKDDIDEETKKGIIRTTKNRIAIISVFAYGIIFMLLIATKSFRELFGIPEFDLGFNTNMPTIIFTYVAMLYCLNYFAPKFTLDKK